MEMSDNSLLEMKNITMTFPGTVALDSADFSLVKGEVHAIVGENGAGKSTLMKILSGAYTKTSGTILLDGKTVEIGSAQESHRLGIRMIYQELENVLKLSVAENIFLGRLPNSLVPGLVDFKRLNDDTTRLLREYETDIVATARLSRLTTAQQQFVEIIKAVSVKNAKIVIMDEPTSSLTKDETDKLFQIIAGLKRKNVSTIYISHRLDEVMDVADRVTVFRDGKNRGTLAQNEFSNHSIITLMVGHEVQSVTKRAVLREKVIFEIKNLSIRNKIKQFNAQVYQGEILGIAGLMGSGKDELVKSLFGLWPAQSKQIFFDGKRVSLRNPYDAIKHGIVYLPEERKVQSLFLSLSLQDNISALWIYNVFRRFFLNGHKERRLATDQIEKLDIRTPSASVEIVTLSGGNQQKAVISRLMLVNPRLLILNDPTRGIDVKSKEAIYGIIRGLSENGVSVVLLSSEIPEIIKLAHRVIVLSRGEICGEFADEEVTTTNILRAATKG